MFGHLWHSVVDWSNQNGGFVTLIGCVLGIPGVFFVGWSIQTYLVQKRKDEAKEKREREERALALEQAQWRGIYRLLKEIGLYAANLHASSLRHSEPARQMAASGVDVMGPYQQAGMNLVAAIGSLVMELTLIPQCKETLSLVEFFNIKYRSAEQRATAEFGAALQEINAMVLAKAGGKPLELPMSWKDKMHPSGHKQ